LSQVVAAAGCVPRVDPDLAAVQQNRRLARIQCGGAVEIGQRALIVVQHRTRESARDVRLEDFIPVRRERDCPARVSEGAAKVVRSQTRLRAELVPRGQGGIEIDQAIRIGERVRGPPAQHLGRRAIESTRARVRRVDADGLGAVAVRSVHIAGLQLRRGAVRVRGGVRG
jgi:hypothetical protein